jgi:hypothetical protein
MWTLGPFPVGSDHEFDRTARAARLPAAWRYWPQCTVLRLWSKGRPPTDGQRIQPAYNRKGLAWAISL